MRLGLLVCGFVVLATSCRNPGGADLKSDDLDDASSSCQANLTASDQTSVALSFTSTTTISRDTGGCGGSESSVPSIDTDSVVFRVKLADHSDAHKVRVVFQFDDMKRLACHGTYNQRGNTSIDLTSVGDGIYEGKLNAGIKLKVVDFFSKSFELKQTVSLVVDGEWKEDPVSQSHDFQISMIKACSGV